MNTRTFKKVLISKESMVDKFNKLAKAKFDSLSEEKTDKYQMRTYWMNKRPAYKYYKYASWSCYLHDFVNQVNYQYIPA